MCSPKLQLCLRLAQVSGNGYVLLQAGAPVSARESLHEGADKKNPGEEGYGSLQGRATAAYSPYTTRWASTLTKDSPLHCSRIAFHVY